jgi:transcription elongation factor GreB
LHPAKCARSRPRGTALQAELLSLDPGSRRAQALSATLLLLVVQRTRCEGRGAFGCWVTLRDGSGAARTWRIVGPDEADVGRRQLSVASPLGQALLDKQVGDAVALELPRGEVEFEVVRVASEPP